LSRGGIFSNWYKARDAITNAFWGLKDNVNVAKRRIVQDNMEEIYESGRVGKSADDYMTYECHYKKVKPAGHRPIEITQLN
jgi:hypothetical protein